MVLTLQQRIDKLRKKGVTSPKVLAALQKEGYLFHGSNQKYGTLVPTKAE